MGFHCEGDAEKLADRFGQALKVCPETAFPARADNVEKEGDEAWITGVGVAKAEDESSRA